MVTENIKQLLLSDGSEIICRIEEELEDDLIISNAYKIVRVEAALSGSSYYTFKPFMTFVEENSHLISLNLYHIISATVPFDELHGQYVKIMASVKEIMNAVDESLDATSCKGKSSCNEGIRCNSHNLWQDLNILVDNYLSKISILNLAKADPNPHIQVTEIY